LVLHAHRRRLHAGSAFGPSSEEVALTLRGELGDEAADADAEDERVATAVWPAGRERHRGARLSTRAACAGVWLDKVDLAIIATLLAPELDPELERAFSFAIDDFTKKRVDISFLGRLIGGRDEAAIDRRVLAAR